jgi:pyruvate formate lyase activating enzyme
VKQDRVFYIWSKGGVTLSGGEPLHQFDFTKEVLRRCFDENIQTAIETCGFVPWRLYEDVLRHLDLVLYDLKHMDPIKHKKLTGVSNELILENLKRISNHGVPIIIRLPLIPQFNTDQANMIRTADFVTTVKNVSEINLLPFHQYGKDKYYRLSRPYELGFLEGLSVSEKGLMDVREIKRLFESRGLKVLVGG